MAGRMTVHWPRGDGPHGDLYLQEGKEGVVAGMQHGDWVAIYELKTGPSGQRRTPDGHYRSFGCRPGRQGIVALALVKSPTPKRTEGGPEKYDDDRELHSKWFVELEPPDLDGFVPRAELLPILGYKPGCVFRSFGDQRSGVKRLTDAELSEIRAAFRKHPRVPEYDHRSR